MGKQEKVRYREVQYFRQVWLRVSILLIAVLMWYLAINQIIFDKPMGNNPAPDVILILFWIAFGILFPIFILWICKLIIEVREDGIYVRFVPFHSYFKSFKFNEIK